MEKYALKTIFWRTILGMQCFQHFMFFYQHFLKFRKLCDLLHMLYADTRIKLMIKKWICSCPEVKFISYKLRPTAENVTLHNTLHITSFNHIPESTI